jgi:hypothetical protein
MLTLLAVTFYQIPAARANPGFDDPQHIHLTYEHSPTSTITVTWQTVYPASGDNALYDTVSHGGSPSEYAFIASGSCHTYSGATGYIHDVELTNLTPDTVYYFICGGPGNYSMERSFRTAPDTNIDFRFVFGGDSRTNLVARTQVSQAMRHFNPSFVLHVGDMVDDGRNQTYWDPWFQDVNDNWVGDNGLTIPIVPALGNHENNATNYYEQFALPGNEQWFYYDWGPTVRIIVLNDGAFPSQVSGDEVTWLNSVLNSTPAYMRKIVMFHRNVYQSSGAHGEATDLQTYWVPVFDRYHVDVVIEGHTHNYARSKPMFNNAPVWSYRNGTIYVTAGGWGAPLSDYINPESFFVNGSKQYHFVLASAYRNGSLHLEAKDINGSTFDELWFHSPLKYWDFPNGIHVRVQDANITKPPTLTNDNITVTMAAPNGTTSALSVYCGGRGAPLTILGLTKWSYDNDTKILTASDIQCNGTRTVLISWVNLTSLGPGPEPLPTFPSALVYGFVAFLAAGVAISALGVILEGRRRHRVLGRHKGRE